MNMYQENEKMDDNVSVTTSCLAVADNNTTSRRSGGCVGIFFQLFDWNRRFAKKKKLFSKRLLAPDRAKKFGGDEKLPNLRLIGDANNGSFRNRTDKEVLDGDIPARKKGVQTPSLVARLMGLESMPLVQCDKLIKYHPDAYGGRRGQKVVGENDELDIEPARQEIRPQKLQKTGIVDRRSVTRFGAEALELKNVLSRSRNHQHHHHPKLTSPVQNTSHQSKRSNASRLTRAATRVLESGLQARNKSKYTISYGARNRMKGETLDSLSQQASCKNCGNVIDILECKCKKDVDPSILKSVVQEQDSEPQNYAFPKRNNQRLDDVWMPFNGETKDFVALNRRLMGQPSRVTCKVEDVKFDKRQKRQLRPGLVSKARSTGTKIGSEVWKPDYQGEVVNKIIDGMPFRFSSAMKNRCEVPRKLEKRRNNLKCSSRLSEENICLQRPIPLRINANPQRRTPATKERRITRNAMEYSPKWSHSQCRNDYNIRFCLQSKLQTTVGLIRRKNSDHLSPGSVLEASFSNDSCCSSSLEDSSAQTMHADSINYEESETNPFYSGVLFKKKNTHNKLSVDLLTYISQVLSTIDTVHSKITGNIQTHIKRVIFNSELVLSNQMLHNPNELNSFFICDVLLELDTLTELIKSKFGYFLGSQNTVAGYQRFVFDAVIESLDSKYARYSKCGFRAWNNLAPFMGFDVLVHEVVEEVRGWMGFVGVISDELVEGDMSHCVVKWIDFGVEVYQTGAKIAWDILQMLVNEILIDF